MAGGEAEATIVTKVVKDLLGDAAKGVEKDIGKDVAEDAARDGAETAGKDAAERAGTDAAARDTAKPLEDGETGKASEARTETDDPIDVATGEVLFAQTDASLPGVLDLVIERMHLSSYRQGGLYGISWASTLDQRLELTADAIRYAAPDGTIRTYPQTFSSGMALPPTTGPVRPLTWLGSDGYVIDDPQSGQRIHFPAPGGVHGSRLPISAISDRNGNRITFDYDKSGTLTQVIHSGGYRIAVDTDGPAGRERVTALRLLTQRDGEDGEGIVIVRYGYDTAGNLTQIINSSGLPLRFSYDDAGRMTGWRDRNDREYHYDYDEHGRAVRGYGTDGYLNAALTYDPAGSWTVLTDSLGHKTTYRLNERRQVIAETNPLGHTTTSEWDDRDRLTSRTDPLGRTTRFTYDQYGNCTRIQRPDGAQIDVVFDEPSNPVQITGADGATWHNTYDRTGNLITATDPLGASTHCTYDRHGRLTAVTDALGNTTRIEPNPAGLAVQVTDPLGATVVYQRDALGRVISIADPVGGTARLGWSVENRLTTLILPSGASETWEYDPEGNPVTHVDAIGQITRTTYGPFDLPVSETKPDGTRLEFSYDTELRLVQVTNPQGLRWRYTYDSTGDLVQETDFNDRVLRYTHDPAGQLSRRVNGAGEPIDYVRDALGNITEQRSGDRVTRFAYDAAGRLTRAISPDADLALHYDALGRVLAETCNGRTLTSTYDAVGRQIHRRTPSGAEANWTYDRAGRPVGLATAGRVLQLTYDAAGRETRRHIGTGAILDQQYDADHQLISQALWGAPATRRSGLGPAGERSAADGAISPNRAEPRLLQHRTYTRRRDGHVTAIGDRLNGNRTFDLDRAGRVTAVNAHSWTERYAYDPAGNLTHTTVGDRPEQRDDPLAVTAGDHTYSGNLVRRAGRTMYDHDGQGRLIRRRHRTLSGQTREWSYTWDADDRLTAVTTPEGQQWRYHYDALGRRTAKQRLAPDKVTVSEETLFAWEGPHLAEQTTRVPGNPEIFSLTWDRDGIHPLAQTERRSLFDAPQHVIDQRFFAIVTDLVGTPTELVSGTGDIAWRSSATLWGVTTGNRGATAYTPLRFPGQYFDPETQLHYNYFRHYDPTTALYTSPDPLGLDAGPNPRAYVLNPLGWVDYLGLLTCKENAAELRKNMAADTPPRVVKPGEAAAHIVPSGMNRGPSAQSRALLAKYKVDINEAANGIPLGHPTPHNFTHYKAFLVRVHNHLTQVEQRGLVRGLGRGAIGNELRGALRDIGKAVQGELAGGNPGPGAIWTKVP